MKNILKSILVAAILLFSINSFAQDEDENPDLPPGDPGAPVPIDNYLPLLILGASALGVYFLKKKEVKSSC